MSRIRRGIDSLSIVVESENDSHFGGVSSAPELRVLIVEMLSIQNHTKIRLAPMPHSTDNFAQ